MARKMGLGKGFDALFPSDFTASEVIEFTASAGVLEIALSNISPMRNQPRSTFDDEKIEQLSYSIKEHGVLQPIVLVERGKDSYEIVAGERRYRASLLAGLKTIPAVVRTVTDLQQLELALVENIQREDLSAIDQAISIRRLHEDFSLGYEAIAKKLGKAESTVVNLVRLLNLPKEFQVAIVEGIISEGHARALLALSDDELAQRELFEHIKQSDWTVRKAEAFVKAHKLAVKHGTIAKRAQYDDQNDGTKALEQRLSREVRIQRTANGGRLTIRFASDDDLDRLLRSLG